MPLRIGDWVNRRYRLLESLGQGGMATVFLVEDVPRRTRVVLKELRAPQPELLQSFRAEFALLAGLSHPKLSAVHDFGSARVQGELLHYYTAEWIEGTTLAEHARRRGNDVIRPLADALEGLASLHAIGIAHGDFTPSNVLVRGDGSGVLIDLGCARPCGQASDSVSGTPGYLAPELLATGVSSVASDLYAVGASLASVYALSGERPRPALAELMRRLSAPEPHQRPDQVSTVLEALGVRSARRAQGLAVRSLQLVGREAERAQFDAWLAALIERRPRERVLALAGRRGSGKTRLVRELGASAELSLPVLRAAARDAAPVQWLLGAATEASEPLVGVRGALAAAEQLVQRGQALLLVLEDADLLSSDEATLLAQFARSLDPNAPVGLLVSGVDPLPGLACERLALRPLDAAALGEWTRHGLSTRTLNELVQECEGLPARIELALARMSGPTRASTDDLAATPALELRLAGLSVEQRALLALVTCVGELEPADWGYGSADFGFGFERALFARDRSRVGLHALVDAGALERALGRPLLGETHRRVAAALGAGTCPALSPAAREAEVVRHLFAGERASEGAARLVSAEPLWRFSPGPFLACLGPLEPHTLSGDALGTLAEIALGGGEPRFALSLSARLLTRRPAALAAERARLLGAEARLRLGRGARAARALERLLHAGPSARRRALALLARARVQSGDYAGAERAAREAFELPGSDAETPLLHEALGAAALYGGRPRDAEQSFAQVLSDGDALTPRDRCRLFGYLALCAFRAGDARAARDRHAQALELAERGGLDDLIGTCRLNLGTALQQLGDLGAALEQYQQGLLVARAVGRESTELVLLYNRLNVQVEIGDFERAEAEIPSLAERAERAGLKHFAPSLALIEGEIALATGDLARAEHALDTAARGFDRLELQRERIEVELGHAELDLQRGSLERALERTLDAERRATAAGAADLSLRVELAHARYARRRRDAAALVRAEAALGLAQRSGQELLGARLATELGLLAEACGAPGALEQLERARRHWDRLAANLPEALRQRFWADPRRAPLVRFTRVEPLGAGGASNEAALLRRLLSLGRRINSSLSLGRVLEYAVEAAVELSSAERGFLLLRGADGSLTLETRTGADASARPSQSIVERVLASGEPLLTTQAESDARLSGFGSVHAQRLKAVLCVPVATPGETLGALYVDSRLVRSRFSDVERDALLALADHVAVALANARLHAALEQRTLELEAEKRRVERLAADKERELGRLRERVEAQRRTLELRYDYSQIAGRGESMRRVLGELDRIIDSDVSVLIQGESGTGKELIARAIHVHGARKDAAFIGINCASIPETLLESELFGHVRGAFTGADRDKQGLLVAAHGGTLFLDELAELSLTTQAKLLRVLQEREVRPLGAEKSRPIDVRLVCATHRQLAREVEAGRFRQDLFYRVAVMEVRLPALRERIEDLPELARVLLERLARGAGRPAPELAPDALRALATYPFPGNVRELENILTRAFVLSERSRIGAADLGLGRAPARPRHSRTRSEFEAEERERILEALRGARWNVSVVSRSLGIPRNTLYRKLERYGITREGDAPRS